MSVSYAVDFAALLLLGADQTMLVAAASAWSQCTFRTQSRSAPYRTLFSMASLVLTVKAAGWAYTLLGGTFAREVHAAVDHQAAGRRRDHLFRLQHAADRDRDRPVDAPVESSASGTRTSCGARRAISSARGAAAIARRRHRSRRLLDGVARGGAALPDLPHLQGVHGPHPGSAAARRAGVGSAPGDDRSAGAGDRRQGSDRAEPHPPRAGLRRGAGARARHAGDRNSGRQDRGAAPRHRQARGARAHPVEARTADAGRVPEDPHPSAGRRRDHQRRAVPVSGGAADPQPPRALGRQGLSRRAQGRRDSARRAHSVGRRLLRRADVGAAVSQGDEPRRRRSACCARKAARRSTRAWCRRSSTCIRRSPRKPTPAPSRRAS